MTKAIAVAKWEYLQKLRTKAFLISLFLMPIIIIAFGVLPTLFVTQEDKDTKVVGVIDMTGVLGAPLAERLESRYTLSNGRPNYIVQVFTADSAEESDELIAEANAKVLRNEIEGYCIIPADIMSDSLVSYRSKNVGDFRTTNRIEENLRTILSERKLRMRGLDPGLIRDLRVPLTLKTEKLTKSGETEEGGFEKVWFTAYIFLMMLLFLIQTSGQLLVRGFIEEKSNRIVEVLVSSCRPVDLMIGKVVGLSALGLTQLAFWGVIGVVISVRVGVQGVPLDQALLQFVYFILGYLLYAAIFVAAGSPLTTEQEAQQVTSYLVLILIIPLVIALPAMQNPGALWLKLLTYFPLLTPAMMAVRIPIQTPPLWEIIITIVIMLASIYAAMWFAGRIFRIGILATGKRPSLREVVRWARTG